MRTNQYVNMENNTMTRNQSAALELIGLVKKGIEFDIEFDAQTDTVIFTDYENVSIIRIFNHYDTAFDYTFNECYEMIRHKKITVTLSRNQKLAQKLLSKITFGMMIDIVYISEKDAVVFNYFDNKERKLISIFERTSDDEANRSFAECLAIIENYKKSFVY